MNKFNMLKIIQQKMLKLSDKSVKNIYQNVQRNERIELNCERSSKGWYNSRHDSILINGKKNCEWDHMTKKNIEDIIKKFKYHRKDNNHIINIAHESRFSNINLANDDIHFQSKFTKYYMSDYIMFNKNCDLTFELVDRFLPYIKFCEFSIRSDDDTDDNNLDQYSKICQLDRWIYKELSYEPPNNSKPLYEINWTDGDLNHLNWISNDDNKRLAVRAMLNIMNETPDAHINYKSYSTLKEWIEKYDSWLLAWNINTLGWNTNKTNPKYPKYPKHPKLALNNLSDLPKHK